MLVVTLFAIIYIYIYIYVCVCVWGGPGVAYWLRRCATSRMVPGSIPRGFTGFFSDLFLRQYHGPGIDSAASENEYQEHFLGVKADGA